MSEPGRSRQSSSESMSPDFTHSCMSCHEEKYTVHWERDVSIRIIMEIV